MKTQVAILGAGPAGLFLAHLLHRAGVESVVLERRSRYYVERRVRAGVLEHGAAQMLRDAGVGERLDREGLEHGGINLRFDGESHRIDFKALVGRTIFVYGQQEIVKDLIAARLEADAPILFPKPVKSNISIPTAPALFSCTMVASKRWSATASPAATGHTASAGRQSSRAERWCTSITIRMRGLAFSPLPHRPSTN